jgi:hypothetical protein
VRDWLYQVVVALDQTSNAICGGFADETMSSRAYRMNHRYPFKTYEKIINALFFWQPDHCRKAYESELTGKQRPAPKI